MQDIGITTSQNVKIFLAPASIGERMLAFVIDMLIKAAFLLVIFLVFFKGLNIGKYFDGLDNWSIGAIITLLTFPVYIYTLVLESIMEGQTFGKKISKIKVVKVDGYQAGFSDYLIRWFLRLIDVFIGSGVIGIITMIFSKNNRRFGDMASGTAVISMKNKVDINHTILENIEAGYVPSFPQVIGLTDNDVRIIKDNYKKALATNDSQIIRRISEKITQTLNIDFDRKIYTDITFIERILKDYNFYTGKEV